MNESEERTVTARTARRLLLGLVVLALLGMVALALSYAQWLDAAEDYKAAGYLGQNLSVVLRALGGAPAERKALGVEEQVAGKLAALRGRRSS